MDLGLSNLINLKNRLLPSDFVGGSTYDTLITQLGRGIAYSFEEFCNRKWHRHVGHEDIFTADRTCWIASRFPLETITAVDVKTDEASGWISAGSVNGAIESFNPQTGVIHFPSLLGDPTTFVRITYTGGYWYDTTEDNTGSLPSGATRLPYSIEEAYYLQAMKVWETIDKQGANTGKSGGGNAGLLGLSLAGLDLVPVVRQTLISFRRMAIV
jgi:hypothetical protein